MMRPMGIFGFLPLLKLCRIMPLRLGLVALLGIVLGFTAGPAKGAPAEGAGNEGAPRGEVRTSRTEEIVSRIQQQYEATRKLQADFDQENHLRSLGRVTRSRGRIHLNKPGKIRAEYLEPEKQIVVSNGKRLWIYTPRLKQVIVSDLGGPGRAPVPLLFLAGKGNLRRDFLVTLLDEGVPPRKGGVWRAGQPHRLSLKSKHPGSGFQKMWLEADAESYQITGIEYSDVLGNKTRILFSRLREGVSVSPGLFEFDIPPGVEVLKNPGAKRR